MNGVNSDSGNKDPLLSLSESELEEKRKEARRALGGEEDIQGKNAPSGELSRLVADALKRGSEMSKHLEIPKHKYSYETRRPGGEDLYRESISQPPRKEVRDAIQKTPEPPPQNKKPEEESLAQITIREQERRRAMEQAGINEETPSRARFFLALGITLFLLGAGFISYILFVKDDISIPKPTPGNEYLITANTERELSIQNESELKKEFLSLLQNEPIPEETIQNIKVSIRGEMFIEPRTLLFEFGSGTAPEELSNSLGELAMVGIYGGESNFGFLVLSLSSFSGARFGMLRWEEHGLSSLYQTLSGSARDISARRPTWKDRFIRNQDVRILSDETDDVYLIYSFIGEDTLIIAPDRNTFIELLERARTPERVLR